MPFRRFLPSPALQGSSRHLAATLGLTLMLAACGYKGPLYMPAPPPAPQESLTTPPSGSVTPSVSSPQAIPVPEQPLPMEDTSQ